MKKFTGVLLAFIFVLSMFYPLVGGDSASASAATISSKGFVVSNPEVVTKKEHEDLAVDKKGATRSLSAKESREFQKLVEKEYFKNQKKNTIYTKKGQSNSNSKGMTAKAKAPVNFLRIEHLTAFDSTKGTITISSKIVAMTGKKPSTIWTGSKLYAGTGLYGKYTQVIKYDTKWQGTDIKIGKKTSKTYNNKTTNFYQTRSRTTAGWTGSGTQTSDTVTEEVLVNKKTVAYPKIYNSHNRTTMWTPTKANIAVVPEEKRTKRDTKLKDKFMPWYIKTYGDPNWGPKWPNADIHHELPLKYGGTNAMSNCFPLPRDIHQKTVNSWWASY
ncbi:hypothetical protein ASG65_10490 [Bacillus sp. Leaf13]|nr:hypothetical protein ASG65_10490 [Bacillus sp. Leaf13]KRF61470.1 hypothetical protein ASG99_25590 [Bacillus sp. Soil768D1]